MLQRLARDRSGAGCREFLEVAPHVHPAEGELDLATFGKLWVGGVAIHLQDALEAGKMAEQPLGLAVGFTKAMPGGSRPPKGLSSAA
ncbi:hypothetical protein GA0061098_1001128 [Bradyrhizobium shewense]|uniref:Uncharacterized protein n=1 Tax=Bradyrhizobium shewense TaxID=1761772 RepID=A0A1C3TYK4_9BRAD|nr:hypothetical protein GA0061098_1001128 [Bradyrhizobium shewense]